MFEAERKEVALTSFHGVTLLLFLMLVFFYAMRIIRFGHIVKRLFGMRDFFTELLEIPEVRICPCDQDCPTPICDVALHTKTVHVIYPAV